MAKVRPSVARRRRLLAACRSPVRTALLRRSAGRDAVSFAGQHHPDSAATTPRLAAATAQIGVDIPNFAMTRPPSAGPTVRLRLYPTPWAAIATGKSVFGTRIGKIDSQAGAFKDQAALKINVVNSSRTGEARSNDTIPAKIAISAMIAQDTAMMSRRGSTMSAIAPAGSMNRKIGAVVAARSSETSNGSRSSDVINQPDAVSDIALPTMAMVLAAQMTVQAGEAKTPSHDEG